MPSRKTKGPFAKLRDAIIENDRGTFDEVLEALRTQPINCNGFIHQENDLLARLACKFGRLDIFEILRNEKADIFANRSECLMLAVEGGHTELAIRLIDLGVIRPDALAVARSKRLNSVFMIEEAINDYMGRLNKGTSHKRRTSFLNHSI